MRKIEEESAQSSEEKEEEHPRNMLLKQAMRPIYNMQWAFQLKP